MSIKTAIDRLTGKSSKNIEDAISKIELGGGSGSGDGIFKVTFTVTSRDEDSGVITDVASDKTYSDIADAFQSGKLIFGTLENFSYNLVSVDSFQAAFESVSMNIVDAGINVIVSNNIYVNTNGTVSYAYGNKRF